MAEKILKILIGLILGSAIGSGLSAPFNLEFLGAPIGAIILTALLFKKD